MIAQYKILSRIALFIATYSLIIVAAVAFPNSHTRGPGGPFGGGPGGSYNPSAKANVALFNLPATITPPGNVTLRLVYQGFGTQNYTCNATAGTYSTSGTATAKLLDITQYYTGNSAPAVLPPIQDLQVAGSHFFVPNPLATATDAPQFVNTEAFFIGSKNASVPNAIPSYSVAAVLLQNIQSGAAGGSLADFVVRTNVIGGVVPAGLNTCQAGDSIAIPYKAHYLFFKKRDI